MATIKAIEGRSVHQIQSGQVIVDLCSVVKELVENSLDAGANSIEVRFKNNGLESIEVQDNGAGIVPEDYETIALKHYTSKLSTYNDLDTLSTFGFRGEALSSLCALSRFHIITARDGEAPRGKKLDFETSGKLKATSVTASQRGTTVSVEDLFYNLPVRRRELDKNLKREYGKVLNILNAYACISTGVRFSVSNQPTKGKKAVVFSTKSNLTTRENIANVYGTKTISALIPLDLELELQSTTTQILKDAASTKRTNDGRVRVMGHISRPVFGEGRQTPDRQMFFVNSRPCGLPQIAKAFNEVYRSYNVTQSPFIFADIRLDTKAYDVNVSPDKRTIMLHDQNALLESLKESLTKLFEAQEQTVPQSQLQANKLSAFRPLNIDREVQSRRDEGRVENPQLQMRQDRSSPAEQLEEDDGMEISSERSAAVDGSTSLLQKFVGRELQVRTYPKDGSKSDENGTAPKDKLKLAKRFELRTEDYESTVVSADHNEVVENDQQIQAEDNVNETSRPVRDFLDRIGVPRAARRQHFEHIEDVGVQEDVKEAAERPQSEAIVNNAFDVLRSSGGTSQSDNGRKDLRIPLRTLETPPNKRRRIHVPSEESRKTQSSGSSWSLRAFMAPDVEGEDNDEIMEEDDNGVVLDEEVSAEDDTEEGDTETATPDSVFMAQGTPTAKVENNNPTEPRSEDEASSLQHSPRPSEAEAEDSDEDYLDEEEKKRQEEARVQRMIQEAESTTAIKKPTMENRKRAGDLLKHRTEADSTIKLVKPVQTSVQDIRTRFQHLQALSVDSSLTDTTNPYPADATTKGTSPEERLSLTIAKSDFQTMRIVGQFNLGFILATRSPHPSVAPSDLFIIDQHASSEIHTFSTLCATTTLTPQPLVRPHPLELTAAEEEVVLAHQPILHKNGFHLAVDTSGAAPMGQRCRLLALPTSRETVFDARDLEELVAMLAEAPCGGAGGGGGGGGGGLIGGGVPRPSKVRKMLAMRACRSSVMVGRELRRREQERLVRQMGEIERPWNCPHGRPTMRHLAGLADWRGWSEEVMVDGEEEGEEWGGMTDWRGYLERAREEGLIGGLDDEDDDGKDGGVVEDEEVQVEK